MLGNGNFGSSVKRPLASSISGTHDTSHRVLPSDLISGGSMDRRIQATLPVQPHTLNFKTMGKSVYILLPGVDNHEIHSLAILENVLTLTVKTNSTFISSGSYEVKLPNIYTHNVFDTNSAKLKNGILLLQFTKTEPQKINIHID